MTRLGQVKHHHVVRMPDGRHVSGCRTVQSCLLWEMDVRDVLGLLQQHPEAYRQALEAVQLSTFQRIAACPCSWSAAVGTLLHVTAQP